MRVVEVVGGLFVACSDVVISGIIVNNVDACTELLVALISVTGNASEFVGEMVVSVVNTSTDDNDVREELSVALETPLIIVVVTTSLVDGETVSSIDVA